MLTCCEEKCAKCGYSSSLFLPLNMVYIRGWMLLALLEVSLTLDTRQVFETILKQYV